MEEATSVQADRQKETMNVCDEDTYWPCALSCMPEPSLRTVMGAGHPGLEEHSCGEGRVSCILFTPKLLQHVVESIDLSPSSYEMPLKTRKSQESSVS